MPRGGRIASLTFLAAVDDVNRFGSSRKLVGYSELAPTVGSSGERSEYGAISREGRKELRAVWVPIAHQVAIDGGKETAPLRRWFRRVAARRGKTTATGGKHEQPAHGPAGRRAIAGIGGHNLLPVCPEQAAARPHRGRAWNHQDRRTGPRSVYPGGHGAAERTGGTATALFGYSWSDGGVPPIPARAMDAVTRLAA